MLRGKGETHTHLHALWKYVRIGLAEKLKPKHDLLWDCYNLQGNALWIRSAWSYQFVLQAGGSTDRVAYFPFLCRKFVFLGFFFFPSSTETWDQQRCVWQVQQPWALLFHYGSVLSTFFLEGFFLYHGTAKSTLVCVSTKLFGRGSGPGYGKMLQLIPPVPF